MFELVVHAFLCCDRIITEDNGKRGLIGVFQVFRFHRVPVTAENWFLYCSVGGLTRGVHDFSIRITHGQSSEEVFSCVGEIRIRREREDLELALPVTCTFEHFGVHLITLEIAEEMAATRILRVVPAVAGPSGNGGLADPSAASEHGS